MAAIEIYTTPLCGYCAKAKRLLDSKGVAYIEFDLWAQPERRPEMLQRANGRHTVPQVFINGRHVGGSDDLHALDARGELDGMLRAMTGGSTGPSA
jgi:glutaredoxin 3